MYAFQIEVRVDGLFSSVAPGRDGWVNLWVVVGRWSPLADE